MLTQELHTFARLELVALYRLLKAFPEIPLPPFVGELELVLTGPNPTEPEK